ncbi:glycoside hydrolase family 3 protein [Olivibacter sitiensis]|uniref:glycoside hydrolase family 3 protein n=1 Tax=Olivibacter sitiensis TaxID=376470 RepID=UPI00040AF013|nr:glycoside hydrolase family 3 protein [Olivibacter sitiensis]
MWYKRGAFLLLLGFVMGLRALAQQGSASFIDFINSPQPWVDSVFSKMSASEKVAQLFMVRLHTNLGQRHIDSVLQVVRTQQLGGVVLFQGGPVRHATTVNRLQSAAKIPVLVALDGEWGLGMRLDSTVSYPYQMTLGALRDDRLIYNMGREIAQDFRALGITMNFAPDVDINNNPLNPVINFRSFGENKKNVTAKGGAYMRGLMEGKVIATLKHFPGHGDTDVDSHHDLPLLNLSRGRLDSLEIYPFAQLIKQGAPAVMVAHMNIPALDKTKNLPSTLSRPIVTDLLQKQLGFKGLIVTDAMDMNGVVKYFKNGDADVRAVLAGNDLLELSQNSQRAIDLILKAIRDKRISQAEIDRHVKKILAAKLWLGLNRWTPINTSSVSAAVNRAGSRGLVQRLANASITVLKGDSMLKAMDYSKHTAIISIGANEITEVQNALSTRFDNALKFVIPADADPNDIAKVSVELNRFQQVIVCLHDNRRSPGSKLNYSGTVRLYINELTRLNSLFCVFANPYTLAGLPGIEEAKTILMAYQNSIESQRAAAGAITRVFKPNGRLPVTINAFFRYGQGIEVK